MSPIVGLIFNIVIMAALVATILYARRLSGQLEQMQADKKAFDQLIGALNLAASRAEAAIRSLKETATDSGDLLQERMNKARAMADELEIMVQAGDNLADRLNKLAEKARKNPGPADFEPPSELSAKKEAQPRSRAEKELLDALKSKKTT